MAALRSFRINTAGWRKVLRGEAGYTTRAMIARKTAATKGSAGAGFESEVSVGPNRVRGMVWPATADARRRESREPVLERALNAGRG